MGSDWPGSSIGSLGRSRKSPTQGRAATSENARADGPATSDELTRRIAEADAAQLAAEQRMQQSKTNAGAASRENLDERPTQSLSLLPGAKLSELGLCVESADGRKTARSDGLEV